MFDAIANFFNAIISALQSVTRIADAISGLHLPGLPGINSVDAPAPNRPSEVPNAGTPPVPPSTAAPSNRALITHPEHITARFNDTGSPAWANQPGGKHLGTDFGAPQGSAVYAPYPMHVIALGRYTDAGRMGDYVIGTLADGVEYYSGHLQNVRVQTGQFVNAGEQLGETNVYNHTHIQLKKAGQLLDFEDYSK